MNIKNGWTRHRKGAIFMDLREQKYVCTLAELGNLTRAAERLYISQPALSIYITNLEKNLGVPLFDRSGKKFTLTYAGEQYMKRAEKMLELEREFNEEIEKISRETAGRIRLGISQRRGCFFLPPVIAEYEKRWPEIDLVIREGNLTDLGEMFKNGELDMIVLNRTDVKENMDTELLFQEEFLIAVPVCHEINEKSEYVPGSRYRKLKPEYLNGETLILHTAWQSSRKIEDAILKHNGVNPGRIRVIRSMETAVQMAAEGLGITFIREAYAANFHYRKPVNYYILDIERHKRDVVVAFKKNGELPAYMQGMVDILKEYGKDYLEK